MCTFYVLFADLGLGHGLEKAGLGLGLGLEGAGLGIGIAGIGLVTASLDYNTVNIYKLFLQYITN